MKVTRCKVLAKDGDLPCEQKYQKPLSLKRIGKNFDEN